MQETAYISIGSNVGSIDEKAGNCRSAAAALGGAPGGAPGPGPALDPSTSGDTRVIKCSSLYETLPWGRIDQPPFVNCAVEVETALTPLALLKFLKSIEADMGRPPTEAPGSSQPGRWGPRVIDLDIVFYNDVVINEEGLTIPHPHAHERGFVLVPLSELAPELRHPVLGKTVIELAGELDDRTSVKKVA